MLPMYPLLYINHISPFLTPCFAEVSYSCVYSHLISLFIKISGWECGIFHFWDFPPWRACSIANILVVLGNCSLTCIPISHHQEISLHWRLEAKEEFKTFPNQVSIYKSSVPSRATQGGNHCWLNLKSVLGGPDFKRVTKSMCTS